MREPPDEPTREASASELTRVQRAELLARLAGRMAHDLKNCLATIRIHGDLALADAGDEAAVRKAIAEIQTSAEHAGTMVRRLLSCGRMPHQQRQVVDLPHALQRAATLLEHALPEEIELQTNTSTGEAAVLIDPAELDQLILNLALNASDAMPEGGTLALSTRSVDVGADEAERLGTRPGAHVALRVSDDGIGIEPDVIQQIFDPWFTTKEHDGMGLGLARVAEVVKDAGGAVAVESEPGLGTSFEVFFPAASGKPCESSDRGSAAWSRGTETVLVVEADDPLRCVATRLLELQGYRVISARTPTEAQMAAKEACTAIDLLLTDAEAQDTARELESLPTQRGRRMKVLLMPGQSDSAAPLQEDPRLLGKPFGGEDLLAAVRRLLDA
ncbi:MAG: hybrid sensor histidine kinase/response regulator [Myxococcota bacterium]